MFNFPGKNIIYSEIDFSFELGPMFYSIKKSSKTRKEAAVNTLDQLSKMEEEIKRDTELIEQQKAAEAYVRPSATSIRKFYNFISDWKMENNNYYDYGNIIMIIIILIMEIYELFLPIILELFNFIFDYLV